MNNKFPDDLVDIIKDGVVGVIPTDTMYGVVASALNEDSVKRLRELRGKPENKPLIVLISNIEDLSIFDIQLSAEVLAILKKIWPAQVSIELPVSSGKFDYISGGTGHFAIRLPDDVELRDFISKTGPLVAPSANPAGGKPAETMDEAWEYFPELDFYIEGGVLPQNPSTLVSIQNNKLKVHRQGKWQVPSDLV